MESDVDFLLRNTDYSMEVVGHILGLSFQRVQKIATGVLSVEERLIRSRRSKSLGKRGVQNPMHGKFGVGHHNYKGHTARKDGYVLVPRPTWYTRSTAKHILEHNVVACQLLGVSALPKKVEVHHIDEDRANNEPANLAIMSSAAHKRLHRQLRERRK